jgi:hypothetical protein
VSFVLRYGNAKLYRTKGLDVYRVYVFAGPRSVEHRGESLLHIGGYGGGSAYLREKVLVSGAEAPIFESQRGGAMREVAASFADWLSACGTRARATYKKKEWTAVLRGPPPFSARELEIVEARRRFSWKLAGVTPSGELRYEVRNDSDRRLPFLSIGVRDTAGTLQGGVWLPVGHVAPGETAIIDKDTYRGLVDPNHIEAYELPDPEPEERERYWEFRSDR